MLVFQIFQILLHIIKTKNKFEKSNLKVKKIDKSVLKVKKVQLNVSKENWFMKQKIFIYFSYAIRNE